MNTVSLTSLPASAPATSQAPSRAQTAEVWAGRIALTLLLVASISSHAFAQGGGGTIQPDTILKAVLNIITGAMGQTLAALGIIACGLSWMFGRASVGMITGVVGGIIIVFGSSYIAQQLIP